MSSLRISLFLGLLVAQLVHPQSKQLRKVNEKAVLKQESFLYRIPALSGGPVEGLSKPLPAQSTLHVSLRSGDERWVFVDYEGRQGWVEASLLEGTQELAREAPKVTPQKIAFPRNSRPVAVPEQELLNLLESAAPGDAP